MTELPARSFFRRVRVITPHKNVIVVRCACKACGESFELDIRDGLYEAEAAHMTSCKQRREPLLVPTPGQDL